MIIMDDKIIKLKEIIANSNNIVVMTGAGVSTLSGIPDFRSKDGLYNMKYKYDPEEILSHHFFMNNTEEFYEFYRDKMNSLDKLPNILHEYLAKLEEMGKLEMIITQNIDGLHTRAGNKKVIELHGSILNNYCMKCHKYYDANYVFNSDGVPKCSCGGIIKPDVVLYEEALKEEDINNTISSLNKADTLLVIGTSLLVYPAASFVGYFRGNNLVIINNDKTNYDKMATLVINDDIFEVTKKLM